MIRTRTYILLILFIGFLLYAKGLFNGFVGDDDIQILRNTKVHSLTNLPSFFSGSTYENAGNDSIAGIFYRPVMMSVFSIIYSAFGPNAVIFHLVQLLFHIANAILVFVFLRQFFRDKWAFICSLFFLIHPVNSETVLYSSNLQEVLFFFFGMVALVLMQQKDYRYSRMLLVPFMILASLFSKESGLLFMIMVIFYSWIFDKERKRLKFLLLSLPVPFGVYLFFRYFVAHMHAANSSLAPITNATLFERIINIPAIIMYYLRMFFYPMTMGVDQFWIVKSPSFWNFWMPLLIAICFVVLVIIGYIWTVKKHKANKYMYLFFMLWFFLGLSLHLQILPLDATVADRWFYFPGIGLIALIGICFKQLKIKGAKYTQILLNSVIVLLLLLCFTRTFTRISDWKNALTLYEHNSEVKNNFILENAYGTELIKNGQFKKAKGYITNSIAEHPYTANLNNLAIIYTAEGNKTKAKETFKKAIETGQNFSVHENYANFLLYYDNPSEALKFSQTALKIFPDSPKLWLVKAKAAYLKGNKEEALKAAATSYKLQPAEQTLEIFTKIQKNKPLKLKKY